MILIVEAGFMK